MVLKHLSGVSLQEEHMNNTDSSVSDQGKPADSQVTHGKNHRSSGKILELKPKELVIPHLKVSLEDLNWVRSQPPCVQQLWLDCAAAEQFGSQQRKLETGLSKNSFPKAKAALEKQGLFKFERIYTTSRKGRAVATGWKIENLHGYYNKKYWESPSENEATSPSKRDESAQKEGDIILVNGMNQHKKEDVLSQKMGEETAETLTRTTFENSQPMVNHCSTTHQLPPKGVGGVVSITSEEEEAPFKGVLPKTEVMPEKEINIEPLSKELNKTSSLSNEPKNLGEDQFSAAEGFINSSSYNDLAILDACLPENEVGHVEPVQKICQLATDHSYHVKESERDELMGFTLKQLELVSKVLQGHPAQRSSKPTADKFRAALALGKRSLPHGTKTWRRIV